MRFLLITAITLFAASAASLPQKETRPAISAAIPAKAGTRQKRYTTNARGLEGGRQVCHGVVHYRTAAFLSAARRAAEALSEIPWPSSGAGFEVVWTFRTGYAHADGDLWDDYAAFHGVASGEFATGDVCINLVEIEVTSEPSSGSSSILGSAAECAACSPDWNVALVRSGLGPDLTYSVILHELGHLFCAPHLSGNSDGVMSRFAGPTDITPESVAVMSRSMQDKFVSGACPAAGQTSASHGHVAIEHDHDHKHAHSHSTFDAYDTTLVVVFGALVFFILVSVVFWGCGTV